MNPQNRLITKHFMNRHNISPFQSVLNFSQQSLILPVKIEDYQNHRSKLIQLPYRNQTFDFVIGQEHLFKNPFAMVNECMRLAKKGGILQLCSPLDILILGKDEPFVVWPDRYSHSLCIIPHYKVFIPNRSKWLDLIRYNPLYLHCFYHWDNPMEINIKTFLQPQEEIYETEYVRMMTDILHESVSHTQEFLKQHQD